MTTIPVQFTRTTCACAECVQCCKDQPGPLAPGDLERIAAYLDKPVSEILHYFWASPGALVQDSRTGVRRMIGTITPQRRRGRCVFLDEADRCRIHAASPFGCGYADPHMSDAEWQQRALWLYRTVETDVAYQSMRRTLAPALSWKPRTGKETV